MRSKLAEARKAMGMKQEDVANKIGVTKSFISYIENGRMNPSLNVALQLAELYNIEIDPTDKVQQAFLTLGRLPVKDIYHVASVFGIEFDSNGFFKEDNYDNEK